MKSDGNGKKTELANNIPESREDEFRSTTGVTNKHDLYQQLHDSEEKYRSLFELSPIGITILDTKGFVQACNDAVYKIGGFSEEEIVGKHFSKIGPVRIKDIPKFTKVFTSLLTGKVSAPFEVEYNRKDGTTGWTEIQVASIKSNGRISGIQVMQRDITERKKAEHALIESEQRYKGLFELSPIGIVLLDTKGVIQSCNDAVYELSGYTEEELVGKHFSEITPLRAKDIPRFMKIFASVITGKKSKPYEVEYIRKDGTQGWTEIQIAALKSNGSISGIQVLQRDVTERKKTEQALLENEQRYRALFENLNDAALLADAKTGCILDANKKAEELLVRPRKNIIGVHMTELHPPGSTEEYPRIFAELSKKGQAFEHEGKITTADGTTVPVRISAALININGEQCILGLFSDITERLKSEEALRESEEIFRVMFDNSADILSLWDFEGNLIRVNKTWTQTLGFTAKTYGNTIGKIHPDDRDRVLEYIKAARSGNTGNKSILYRHKTTGGDYIYLDTMEKNIQVSGRKLRLVSSRDVTEQHRIEEALQESEEFNTSLLENALHQINVINPDGSIRYVNPTFRKENGWKLNDVIGMKPPFPWWPEEQKEELMNGFREAISGGKGRIEVLTRRKNGELYWLDIAWTPVNHNGKLDYILVNGVDITERKQAELALKENEAFRSSLLNMSPNPIFVSSPDTSIRYVNPALEELSGFTSEELIGKKIPYPWWREERWKAAGEIVREGLQVGTDLLEVRFTKKTGEDFWVEVNSTPIKLDGELQYTLVTWNNIDERKKAEIALKESEDIRLKLLDISPNPIMVINPDGTNRYVNPAFEKLTGFSAKEVIGKKPPNPWWRESVKEEAFKQARKDLRIKKKNQEVLFKKKNGENFWVSSSSTPVRKNGKLQFSLITWTDITERKQAEEEVKLRAMILDSAGDGINVIDLDGKFVYVNEVFCKSHGYTRYELMGMNIRQLVPEINSVLVEPRLKEILAKRETEFETVHIRRDGSQMIMEVHSRVLESRNRNFILNVERDITERHKKEEEIQKFSAAIEYSPNIVMITDRDAVIEYVNDKYTELTGYNEDEIIGKNMREIDLQPLKEQRKMWRALARGEEWYYEYLNRKKNDELYYEATSISAIKDKNGEITHFVRVGTDITEKKRTEGELQRSEQQLRELSNHMRQIREEERKSIARNIHDNLGQSLTALKIDMSWLIKRLTTEQLPLIEKANEMAMMIDQNIQTVKKLSSELRPEVLDILGLAAAIEWYTEEFSQRTGIKYVLSLGEENIELKEECLVDCYRILQESLTNVSRHAGATRVRINMKQEPDKLVMLIKDNGKGITKTDWDETRSFGLMGMRERANSIGGKLEIKSTPGKGTTVKLTVPTK